MPPKFTVIIPARNEERLIGACLESIQVAGAAYLDQLEVLVVLNRCTDRTEEIAKTFGARTIREDAKILARIRNAGAQAAAGEILVTIDADSRMSPGALAAMDRALASGTTVGGGADIRPDRWSVGIQVTLWVFNFWMRVFRLSCGMFWCYRRDFEAIKGFDEGLLSAEDLDFARRLKAHGKRDRRRFRTLPEAYIVTSCRKFDVFGDWCAFTRPRLMWHLFHGKHRTDSDAFYYDFKR